MLLGKVLKVDFIYTLLQTTVEFLKIPPKFDIQGQQWKPGVLEESKYRLVLC
jgi:hypothetical protein